jgi:tyrosyl-tRNA synthetase
VWISEKFSRSLENTCRSSDTNEGTAEQLKTDLITIHRMHLMNPLVPGLSKSGKMSSSEPLSKIDFDDSDEVIRQKLELAHSIDGQVEGNGMLAMLKYVIFRRLESQDLGLLVRLRNGTVSSFRTYEEVEHAFAAGT